MAGKISEMAVLKMVNTATGTESEKNLGKMYEIELRRSKDLHDEVDKLMQSEVGKFYKKLENAK